MFWVTSRPRELRELGGCFSLLPLPVGHIPCFTRHSYEMEEDSTIYDRRRIKSLLHKTTEVLKLLSSNNFSILYSRTLMDISLVTNGKWKMSRGRRAFSISGLQERFFWISGFETGPSRICARVRARGHYRGWRWPGGKVLFGGWYIKPMLIWKVVS